MIFTSDFETTTRTTDCRVWAFGLCEIGNPDNFIYGNNIDDFMKICADKKENHTMYFHNLKFDGMFLLSWLGRNGFEDVTASGKTGDKTYKTLISDKRQFYKIEVFFSKKGHKTNKVTFLDSLKILNFSVKKIAKDFNLPIRKLEIGQYSPEGLYKHTKEKTTLASIHDVIKANLKYVKEKREIKILNLGYKGFRKVGHELTQVELEYLKNDVLIMALALKYMFNNDMSKMTIGADALFQYKEIIGKYKFYDYFPTPDIGVDTDVRKTYRGGFTYLNPKFKDKIIINGIVLDVNSLYPATMYYKPLPFGKGKYFTGEYKKDKIYPLYTQTISCQFKLKKNHIPTIQIKSDLNFNATEYLTSSKRRDGKDKPVVLNLTNIDLELFLKHYEVYNLEYIAGYKFKSSDCLFKDYIDKWSQEKIKAKKEKNGAMYAIAKLMLNSLYGKFSLNPKVKSKLTFYDKETDMIKFYDGKEEIRNPIYIPVGTFITSWARYTTITAAQKVYHRFIYADTDSLHLEGLELPEDLEIHDSDLGAWKHEFTFDKGKYLRQKSYMEHGFEPYINYKYKMIKDLIIENEQQRRYKHNLKMFKDLKAYEIKEWSTKITCAGMPDRCYKYVDFDNFEIGSSFEGKLQNKQVPGGSVLIDGDFTIKKNSYF